MDESTMDPRDIKFCQSSIKDTFTKDENLLSVFIKIWEGPLDPFQMQGRIEVYYLSKSDEKSRSKKFQKQKVNIKGNCYYAVEGNRRLYIFKKLHEAGKLGNVPVENLSCLRDSQWKKFTTKSYGDHIKFYHPSIPSDGRGVEKRIDEIIARGHIEESDRQFASVHQEFVSTAGVQVADGGGEAFLSSLGESAFEEEEDVYYESDDDGQ